MYSNLYYITIKCTYYNLFAEECYVLRRDTVIWCRTYQSYGGICCIQHAGTMFYLKKLAVCSYHISQDSNSQLLPSQFQISPSAPCSVLPSGIYFIHNKKHVISATLFYKFPFMYISNHLSHRYKNNWSGL